MLLSAAALNPEAAAEAVSTHAELTRTEPTLYPLKPPHR